MPIWMQSQCCHVGNGVDSVGLRLQSARMTIDLQLRVSVVTEIVPPELAGHDVHARVAIARQIAGIERAVLGQFLTMGRG